MIEKDKQLLLTDLCARIPYGVICHIYTGNYKLLGVDGDIVHIDSPVYDEDDGFFNVEHVAVIPFLRPMSSMTEEEEQERIIYERDIMSQGFGAVTLYMNRYIEWLDSKHFDWRTDGNNKTLIERELALEAPDDMYNK